MVANIFNPSGFVCFHDLLCTAVHSNTVHKNALQPLVALKRKDTNAQHTFLEWRHLKNQACTDNTNVALHNVVQQVSSALL